MTSPDAGRPGPLRRGLLLAVSLAAALASLATVGAPAEATWTKAPNISGTGAAAEPVTAVSANGWAAFAWRRLDASGDWRVELRVRSDAGVLSNAKTVSPAGNSAYAPDVAIDSNGRALVVWSQRNDDTGTYAVNGLYRAPDGNLTNIRDISAGVGAGSPLQNPSPQVEFNPDGSAVVAWETVFPSASYRAVARRMTPTGGVASGWQELSGDGVNLRPVALAVDGNGIASIAWSRNDGSNMRIETRTRTSAGLLGPLRVVSGAGQDATAPKVAVTPTGDAVIAWVRYDLSNSLLYARRVSSAGALGPTTAISGATQDVDDVAPAEPWGEVAVTAGGDAVFAWQQARPCCSHEVAVRGWAADGTRSAIAIAGNARSTAPQVAIGPSDEAQVAFVRRDSNFEERVSVRTRAADGTLGAIQFLSAAGGNGGHPDLAVAPTGLAVVTWLRDDGTSGFCCDRVQYSAGP